MSDAIYVDIKPRLDLESANWLAAESLHEAQSSYDAYGRKWHVMQAQTYALIGILEALTRRAD